MGKANEIMLGPDRWIKFGLQLQVWADSAQDSVIDANGNDGGYVNNFFLRRARVLLASQIMKGVSVFFQLDDPNYGKSAGNAAGKNLAGFILQDAWGEIKIAEDSLILQAGLILVPVSRQLLQSTTTFLTLDIGNTTGTASAPTQELNTRDWGLGLQGFLLDDHLQWRAVVASGIRNPPLTAPAAVGAQNSPRVAGYVQYEFFDTEKVTFVYAGYNFGRRKILGVSAGFDFQKGSTHDAYWAASANAFLSWPLNGPDPKVGDEIAALVQFLHFDGGNGSTPPNPTAAIPTQNDLLVEAQYYNKDLSLGVFGKFETRMPTDEAQKPANHILWFGGGLRYFVKENNLNFTLAYNRAQYPDAASGPGGRNGTNQFTLQIQFYYF